MSEPDHLRSLAQRARTAVRRLLPQRDARARAYATVSRSLANAEAWTAADVARQQLAALNTLLDHARTHCAGYIEKFRSRPAGPLRSLEGLADWPFLTKAELRDDAAAFCARNFAATKLAPVTSGGTTGAPTRFFVEAGSYDGAFDAVRHAMWRRAGWRPGARILNLTASLPLAPGELGAWSDDARFLSIAQLEPALVARWLPAVEAWRPEFLVAFPSTASALARLLAGTKLPASLRGVILASEVLPADQRAELARAFGVRVFSWYGLAELAGFACGCESSDCYHFLPATGIVEIVDDRGAVQKSPGAEGEIVLTGFLNRATPFIRYRTGDRGIIGERCPHCRRPHPVLSTIAGRTQDFLVAREGRQVPLSALNFHSDEFRRVLTHQFFQDTAGAVTLRLVPLDGFRESDRTAIAGLVAAKLGPGFQLTLELVPRIERTARGKIPVIVQRVVPSPAHRLPS